MTQDQPPTTYRQVMMHLGGGLRGSIKDQMHLQIFPTGKREGVRIPLGAPFEFPPVVRDLEVIYVGDEEIFTADGISWRVWHPLCYTIPGKFGVNSPANCWLAIAHSAREAGDTETADMLRHAAFTLTAAGYRLRDLSDAYAYQLHCALTSDIPEGQKFANLEVFNLYLACHSFLVEACSARDYLARFLAKHVYRGVAADSMAKLLKHNGAIPPGHPVRKLLEEVNDKKDAGAWMVRLNEYRDIITHRAPISHLGPHARIELRMRHLSATLSLPQIVFEVPSDPFDQGRSPRCDALALCHRYYGKLMEFADFLAAYSPYKPSHPTFDASNITNLQKLPVVDVSWP